MRNKWSHTKSSVEINIFLSLNPEGHLNNVDPRVKIVCDTVENVFFYIPVRERNVLQMNGLDLFFLINSIWILNTLKL